MNGSDFIVDHEVNRYLPVQNVKSLQFLSKHLGSSLFFLLLLRLLIIFHSGVIVS